MEYVNKMEIRMEIRKLHGTCKKEDFEIFILKMFTYNRFHFRVQICCKTKYQLRGYKSINPVLFSSFIFIIPTEKSSFSLAHIHRHTHTHTLSRLLFYTFIFYHILFNFISAKARSHNRSKIVFRVISLQINLKKRKTYRHKSIKKHAIVTGCTTSFKRKLKRDSLFG